MTVTPLSVSLKKIAVTPNAGFALQNGTPTILTFTTPNDGQNHRYELYTEKHVTTAETGGAVALNFTTPDAAAGTSAMFPGTQAAGVFLPTGPQQIVVGPNTTISVVQTSALTVGASVLFCEIWGV